MAQRFMLTGKPKQADVGTDARLCIDFMKDTVCQLVYVLDKIIKFTARQDARCNANT